MRPRKTDDGEGCGRADSLCGGPPDGGASSPTCSGSDAQATTDPAGRGPADRRFVSFLPRASLSQPSN